MRIAPWRAKQKNEHTLIERGLSTPLLRSEEKGQAIAREIMKTLPRGEKVVFVGASDQEGMALLSASRLLYLSGREVVMGLVSSAPFPPGWKTLSRVFTRRGGRIFSLDTLRGWKRFCATAAGARLLVGTPLTTWEAAVERKTFDEWAMKNFPRLVGIELPLGYPHPLPVYETWSLDFPVEEILDFPLRGLCGEHHTLLSFSEQEETGHLFLSTPEEVAALIRQRPAEGHKGTFGRVLIVGGSRSYPGAVFLAAQGALVSGCGLVTIATEAPLNGQDPQVTYLPLPPGEEIATLETYLQKLHTTTLLIGNGWGNQPEHASWLAFLLTQPYVSRLVIDADGINLLARSSDLVDLLTHQPTLQRKQIVLTPHGGEAVRLLRVTPDQFRARRRELIHHLASQLHATIVQKDATTMIATPEEVWYSCYGNNALAKGGSGDILAGLIAGLLATGYDGRDASLVATFLLGKAAELFHTRYPAEASTPERVWHYLPDAWKHLYTLKHATSRIP